MRKALYTLVSLVAVAAAVGSTLSLLVDTPSRYLKFLDFPRLQFFWAALASVPAFVALTRRWRWYDYALVGGLVAAAGIQAYYLIAYTTVYPVSLADAPADAPADRTVRLLISNVLQDNRDARPLLDLIAAEDPDVVIAMETDARWVDALAPARRRYPHVEAQPNNVAYGMLLMSRFPLADTRVRYLQNEQVPSIHTTLRLRGGAEVDLHAVHPVPPTRYQDLPDNEGQSERAFLMIGELVQQRGRPAVVAGDFNDVAWARTDRMIGVEDLLHDVRTGRGIYASFDADNPLMRWPLDHVFATRDLAVARLELGPDIGSDHFPVLVDLVYDPQ